MKQRILVILLMLLIIGSIYMGLWQVVLVLLRQCVPEGKELNLNQSGMLASLKEFCKHSLLK